MPGTKELIITGSLGEVMRESVQAALSYLRSNAASAGIAPDFFERHDLHIHIPRGAVPKDGPSAGITVLAALASLLTGRPARRDTASTGEITLTGRILPVSGVREKVLAARRAGLAAVVVPAANLAEIEELDEETRRGIEIHTAATVPEALELILRGQAGRRGGAEGRSPAGERSEADGGPQRQDPAACTGTEQPLNCDLPRCLRLCAHRSRAKRSRADRATVLVKLPVRQYQQQPFTHRARCLATRTKKL